MERRCCGSSDLELPVIGVGCWSFGGGEYWGPQEQSDVDAVVDKALAVGCNYFDTAEAYNDGKSETALGRALKGRRPEAIIGTKVTPTNTEPGRLRKSCEASLRRLDTDYIDLYMVHWAIRPPLSTGAAFETLLELQREGKIRHIGVSNFGATQLAEALSTGAQIAVNQLAYSLLSRAIEMEIAPLCRRKGIGVLAYSPLVQGLLADKYPSIDEMPANRTRTRHFSGKRPKSRHGEAGAEAEVLRALERIRIAAERERVPMAQLALAWTFADPAVACVVAGARNPEQLESNARAGECALEEKVIAELNRATEALKEKLGANADYYEGTANSRIR